MADSLEVKLVVEPSLLDHVEEGLKQQQAGGDPAENVVDLLTQVLNGSEFPIAARCTESGDIRVSYHLKSFSQPLF